MQLVINGEMKEVAAKTVADLLQELSLDPKKIVTECNGEIIPRDQYQTRMLQPADKLELVQFVGGG
ncbi:MAG: sulfur carrier protein ThiS [Desulfovibrionaceae bacterium]|nr:sulfur carrier protein ThiS [Desulfovibrionaceae bacterium]